MDTEKWEFLENLSNESVQNKLFDLQKAGCDVYRNDTRN
jgi:hypothetical protein